MTITLEAKPLEIKVEVPGYGIFYLRKMGAAKEAAMQDLLGNAKSAADKVAEDFKDIISKESQLIDAKDEVGLKDLRNTTEYKKAQQAQNKASEELQKAVAKLNKCMLGLWRAENAGALERLLEDFSTEQIKGFYAQAISQAEQDA